MKKLTFFLLLLFVGSTSFSRANPYPPELLNFAIEEIEGLQGRYPEIVGADLNSALFRIKIAAYFCDAADYTATIYWITSTHDAFNTAFSSFMDAPNGADGVHTLVSVFIALDEALVFLYDLAEFLGLEVPN